MLDKDNNEKDEDHDTWSLSVFLYNPSNAEVTLYKDAKIFENHLNPVMLVFIR